MDLLALKLRAAGLFLCAFLNILLAFFLWSKDIKNKLYLHLGFTAFFSAVYSLACASTYFFWSENSPLFINIVFYRSTYLGVFILPSYVCFTYYFVGKTKNLKYKILLLYAGAFGIGIGSMFTPYFIETAYLDFPHIAGVNGKLDTLGRGYIFICLFIGLYNLTREYFRSGGIRKKKIKYYFIGMFLYAGSGIVFTSIIPYFTGKSAYYDFAAYFSLCFMLLTIYAIIRYRFLEIETVVHRTLLWLLSVFLIIFPMSALSFLVLNKMMAILPGILNIVFLSVIFLVFYYYYAHLRPQIDRIFRRKKYDYLEILGEISQQISGIIDLDELSRKTVAGIKETIYPQVIHLFLKNEEENNYYLKASMVDNLYKNFTKDTSSLSIPGDCKTISVLKETEHPMEKELLEVDPIYRAVRKEAEKILKDSDAVLLFGLFMEEELVGLLLLGKRETLQEYTRLDIDALHSLSLNIANSFYTSLHHHDVLEGQRVLQEINLARHIQENLLPQKSPEVSGVSIYGLYVPSREIGGDYYDFIVREEDVSAGMSNRVYVAIGDVSGKGLDAGMIVSSVKSYLSALMRHSDYPLKKMLGILNQELFTSIRQEKFLSLLLLQYILHEDKLVYSSAGHEHILVYRGSEQNGRIEVIKSGGVVAGVLDNIEPYLEENILTFNKGDKVLLYTDGVTEAHNPQEELYGLSRLKESFQKQGHFPIKEVIHNVYGDIKAFISSREQYDDITLVGLEKD